MFSDSVHFLLRKNQLNEVICQLRFPEILIISQTPPANFQEMIRNDFPQYSQLKNRPAPKVSGHPGNFTIENPAPVINHQFATEDNCYRVNLTSTYISVSCSKYTCWEDFASKLDKPLAAFIQTYKPAYFQRIGLRYVNFISRNSLSLDKQPFSDLIQPVYLGPLSEEDVLEQGVIRCSIDTELSISGGCRARIHAGPGLIKRNGVSSKEIHFIFDQDLYMPGNIPVNASTGALQTLHRQAYSIFRGAITDTLFDAMDPCSM